MKKAQDPIRKHDRILEIHSRLMSGEIIRKPDLAEEYGVNPRSIQRDIESIRDFYANRTIKDGEITEIKYDRTVKGFRMISSKTVTLANAELFAVSKILLESRSLSKAEMKKIIDNLIDACLPVAERRKMSELIRNELFHYVEPRHGKELVNLIWELGSAVYSHRKVSLEYKKVNGDITKALVKPVGIMESEYYFYLIAYVGDKDREHPGYPTIYRVDRIKNYKITDETYYIPDKERFEEGEFRKRIPFMYGGKLHKTSFIYKGNDINAIYDRLPTATVKPQENGTYQVDVEVFGETGLNMWLKSQGDYITVI
ncbi:helix-turn-helix transcriptional regulator [Lacrimispora brassicae]